MPLGLRDGKWFLVLLSLLIFMCQCLLFCWAPKRTFAVCQLSEVEKGFSKIPAHSLLQNRGILCCSFLIFLSGTCKTSLQFLALCRVMFPAKHVTFPPDVIYIIGVFSLKTFILSYNRAGTQSGASNPLSSQRVPSFLEALRSSVTTLLPI